MTEINNRIEEVKRQMGQFEATLVALRRNKNHTVKQADEIREKSARELDAYYCQLFPQTLNAADWFATRGLLKPNRLEPCSQPSESRAQIFARLCSPLEEEVQGFDWALRKEALEWLYMMQSNPECQRIVSSIIDSKFNAPPQPLDDKELEKAIFTIVLPKVCRLRPEIDIKGAQQAQLIATEILALLQPKIEWIIQFLEDGGYGDKSKAINWMQFQDKYNIPAGEFSLVEELKIALKGAK